MHKMESCFLACSAEYEAADLVLFGAPFDGTVSYRPGARFGPSAIRSESCGIETYSSRLQKDLEGCAAFDAGDLELPFGNSREALDRIRGMAARIVKDGKLPLMLGGEHLVTLGAVEALYSRYPDLHILHFDAHADLREEYLGQRLSHASVIRRCHDLVGDGRIVQLGIRSMTKEEDAFGKEHVTMHKYDLNAVAVEQAVNSLRGKPVYVTIDLDVLDPSVFPGTGTPEPGGVSFVQLMEAVHQLKNLSVLGCDACELSPHYDHSGISTIAACKIVRELVLTLLP